MVTNVVLNYDVTNGEITLQWDPLGQTSGTITNYFVAYRQVGDRVGKTLTVDGDTTLVVLTGIQSDAAYNVSIRAESSVGEGALWTTTIDFGKGLQSP